MDLFLQIQRGKNRKTVFSGPTRFFLFFFLVNLGEKDVIWYIRSVSFDHFSLNHNEKQNILNCSLTLDTKH